MIRLDMMGAKYNYIDRIMKIPWPSRWWESRVITIPWHKRHLTHLGIFALIVLSLSLVFFTTHGQFRGLADEETIATPSEQDVPAVDIGPPRTPGRCTTWPVGTNRDSYKPNMKKPDFALQSFAPPGGWKKPQGIAVKALIFYGRKRTVDILDCYLQQNLAVNGGYLDEVWFMKHTDIEEDLTYINELVEQRQPQYRLVNPGECQGANYACMWDPVIEDHTIYIKIDDDIVSMNPHQKARIPEMYRGDDQIKLTCRPQIFIHPDTIPQLVSTRIAEPHPYAVSANLVNCPLTGYKHYDVGAIHPFLPDTNNTPSRRAAQLWRPSEFEPLVGAQIPITNLSAEITEEFLHKHVFAEPSYEGHPWLLLEDDEEPMLKTPMGINALQLATQGAGAVYGAAWKSWMISAQQQYSLLRNLELNDMWRYHFGTKIDYPHGVNSLADVAALEFFDPNHLGPGAEQLYDTQYARFNLNFVAVWGHDIRNAQPISGDDEEDITVTIPKRLQRPFVVDTRAVAGHLSFYPQHDGVRQTDLLDRWRAFANEMICAADNQKTPFDPRCPGF